MSPQWKRVGGSEGGSRSCDGCRTYRESLRRRAAAVRVRATGPGRVEAVAMGSAAETKKEQPEKEVSAAGDGSRTPMATW